MTPVLFLLLFFSVTAVAAEGNDKDISEILTEVNANLTNLIDGDIAPNSKKNAAICTYWRCRWPKRGRYVRVPVYISRRFSYSERTTIIRAMVEFHRRTCIRFVWRRYWWQRSYIFFRAGSGCSSRIGRRGGGQTINLKKNYCTVKHVVQHEILHALGFHHEHNRIDRDRYVRINWQNIQRGKKHNFRRTWTNNLGTRYDFNSTMHYARNAFSKNGWPTIVAKKGSQNFGRARSMSYNDIARVNRLYRCWRW